MPVIVTSETFGVLKIVLTMLAASMVSWLLLMVAADFDGIGAAESSTVWKAI